MAGGGSGLAALDAAALRGWVASAVLGLRASRARLDELNVFPVPDGDTGTNLLLSVEGALASGERDLARALLVSARGSSGVILSQLARGWADVLTAVPRVDPPTLARALQRGDELAWEAVGDPVEGTVLSVSRAAAESALVSAERGDDLASTVAHLLAAARTALARTPGQLPALARAGVVDAGGAGLVVVLEALDSVVHGLDAGQPPPHPVPGGPEPRDAAVDGDGPGFEVMYLLRVHEGTDGNAADDLRAALRGLGESVLVGGGDRLWNVHVHTSDPGAAVEAGLAAGRPHRIRITSLASPASGAAGGSALAVVAFASGRATEAACRAAGALVVAGGADARAAAGDLLQVVLRAGAHAGRVLVLPDDAGSAAVASHAVLGAAEHGVRAEVLASRSQVQVLAGLAVLDRHDPDGAAAVAAAVDACRDGAVTVAVRDQLTAAGPFRAGDVLGCVGGEVVVVGPDLPEVACAVADRLLTGGGELVTLVPGAQAGGAATRVLEHLRSTRPDVEVAVVGGGQACHALLVGCE